MAPLLPYTLLVRTDFSDAAAWDKLVTSVRTPGGEGFLADVTPVSDRDYAGWSWQELRDLVPRTDHGPRLLFVADLETITEPDQPIVVVALYPSTGDEDRPAFRVVPAQLWSVENNLTIGNMRWDEFADRLDEQGVFRGFSYRRPPPPRSSGTPSALFGGE
jgi:hypothetical protein